MVSCAILSKTKKIGNIAYMYETVKEITETNFIDKLR